METTGSGGTVHGGAVIKTPTSDEFRFVIGHLASGVTVVTAVGPDGRRYGMTASSVTSLSLDPPMILACLNTAAPTTAVVGAAGAFGISILGEAQGHLARQFARPSADKFDGVAVDEAATSGVPLLGEALAHIACDVEETVQAGTHTVFLGRVREASAYRGMPLAYFRGGFGKFQHDRDLQALELLRSRIIRGESEAGTVLTAAALAQAHDLDPAACYFALTRLLSDGLLERADGDGFRVVPFSAETSDITFDARCAMELAALELGGDAVPTPVLAELRAAFADMKRHLVGETFLDFERYLDANNAFHAAVISIAGNPRVSSAYAGLQIRTVMQRSFGSTPESSERFLTIQRRLLDALESADVHGARRAVRDYNQAAKARAREVLTTLGVGHV